MGNSKRKIILNLATSLDGYIADKAGGFAWIVGDGCTDSNTEKQFDFSSFMNTVDTIVMGRKAYEDIPVETLQSFGNRKIFVASGQVLENKGENIEFIKGDITGQILKLREEEGEDIWIFGGAVLADHFIKANIIDEYIIGIIPTILGSGIPLFLDDNPTIKLCLKDCTAQEGIVIMRYTKLSTLN